MKIPTTKLNLPIVCLMLAAGIHACSSSSPEPEYISNPAAPNSELPFLHAEGDDALFMSWVNHSDNSDNVELTYSRFTGDAWTKPEIVASGSSWFVNWADFPSVLGRNDKAVAAHWLNKIPGNTYSYNVTMSLADDSGRWSEPFVPHDDSTATEHGFVSMINWENDRILAVWLDGRKTAGRADDEYYDMGKAMTLRAAIISPVGEVEEKYLIDDAVCDCCQTSLVRTPDGALVAYRDRSDEEIRDISISRFENGNWTEPQTIHADNWQISACPVNGPGLAASDSVVVLSWFTGAGDVARVKAAVSHNSGNTFSEPYPISQNQAIGRVDAAADRSGVFISWMEKEGERTLLRVRSIDRDGALSGPKTIAEMEGSRRSGFPRMERLGNHLVFAWTDISGSAPAIRTARLAVEGLNNN